MKGVVKFIDFKTLRVSISVLLVLGTINTPSDRNAFSVSMISTQEKVSSCSKLATRSMKIIAFIGRNWALPGNIAGSRCGFAGVVFLLPAVISFTRAFANAILLFHAYSLYIMLEGGPDGREML